MRLVTSAAFGLDEVAVVVMVVEINKAVVVAITVIGPRYRGGEEGRTTLYSCRPSHMQGQCKAMSHVQGSARLGFRRRIEGE